MRLLLLLGSLGLILQQIEAQHSWWNRGYRGHRRDRRRDRPRRYRQSDGDHPRRRHRHTSDHLEAERASDVSSSHLSRRLSQREGEARDYYPHTRANTSHLVEATPEYRIETREGDTIIQFARSGETQGIQ